MFNQIASIYFDLFINKQVTKTEKIADGVLAAVIGAGLFIIFTW